MSSDHFGSFEQYKSKFMKNIFEKIVLFIIFTKNLLMQSQSQVKVSENDYFIL